MLRRLLAALAVSLLAARAALACSICGCDPAAGTLGLDRPSARWARVALESRFLSKDSGEGSDAEGEREGRAVLRVQYAPLTRLVLQAELPAYAFKNHVNALGVRDDVGRGLGDVAFSARYELLRLGGLAPRHTLALLAGLKLPTGANDRTLPGETEVDEHLQLGTGSYDTTFGLSYVYGEHPWALFAEAKARVNGSNGRGFQYGNALFGTLGARRNFLDSERLIVSLEAQLRSAGMDRLGGGGYDPDSGGQILYGTGSVAYALTDDLLVRAIVQVPTATWLNGVQTERTVTYLQLAYDFAL